MNDEMAMRAIRVMTGNPEAEDKTVFEAVVSYAKRVEKLLNGSGLVLRFETIDDCDTALKCFRDAKADVDRTSSYTILVWA